MDVPIGLGMLKVAAWMVPKGEAITCICARAATPGWRTSSAPRSWKPIVLGSNAKSSALNPTVACLRRRRLRETAMTPLTRHNNIYGAHVRKRFLFLGTTRAPRTPADCRQCYRLFYGLINLANALTLRGGVGPLGRDEIPQHESSPPSWRAAAAKKTLTMSPWRAPDACQNIFTSMPSASETKYINASAMAKPIMRVCMEIA